MVEFNPDGSIKLSDGMAKKKEQDTARMQTTRCMKVRKDVVNFTAPKKCLLKFTLSPILNNTFIDTIYKYWNQDSSTPSKLKMVSEKEFEVEIGTDFRRCTDCCSLVNRYREFLDGNVILDKGSCTFKGREFVYEDMFE
jgi:hypothetical protein